MKGNLLFLYKINMTVVFQNGPPHECHFLATCITSEQELLKTNSLKTSTN